MKPISIEQTSEERARGFWERIRARMKFPGASSTPIAAEWADAPRLNQREYQVLNDLWKSGAAPWKKWA